ncbi:MAG: glycosyltransferase, partial [Psychrobacillus sp.]
TIGRLGRVKDCIKKHVNIQPQGRIFLNEHVKQQFNFKDQVPSITRDMGIDSSFFQTDCAKEYEFVYIGDMNEQRQLDKLLESFRNSPFTILMIGTPNDRLFNEFKSEKNIIFTGRVSYKEVPLLASKAVYGVNFIPNKQPYNEQTSTKLLEYCALNLKIVTTNYSWVRRFEQQEKASFYKISTHQKIDFDILLKHEYRTPNVDKYEWNKVLDNADLVRFLTEITKK